VAEWLGRTIGKVRIDKYLARGGMAEVYLGTHLTLERPVAVKVLHSYIEEDLDLLERFHREAKIVAGLRHPNIVQIYDFDTVDGHPYIVMEYLKGPPLSIYLRNLHKRNERIPHHQVARLLKALTSALDYAHEQNVIHRDIKPGNILLHGKADEIPIDQPLTSDVEAVLTDFGLVRIVNTASQTTTGRISGTPAYMSPEQARGDRTDHRTDIYSLGIVLYEMLAGRVPFEADSTLSVIYKQINDPPPPIPGISPPVQKVMDRALLKNPDDRYQTSRDMAVDFFLAIGMTEDAKTISDVLQEEAKKTLVEASSETTRQASDSEKPKPTRRKSTRLGLGIFLLIGLLTLVIGAILIFSKPGIFPIAAGVQPTASAAPTTVNASLIESPVPTAKATSPASSVTPTAKAALTTEIITPTADIASSNATSLPDANGMVEVPSGVYEVGATSADQYHIASKTIQLNDFWIDQYQVTFEQYQEYLTANNIQAPDVIGEGTHPVRGVSWDQAAAYCSWVNKRLPTEAEWEAAGRGLGPNPQLYPWGNDPMADGSAINLPDQDTYKVGTISFNKSPFNVYDMVGNIWEWVGEPYESIPSGMKIVRGGRFGLPIEELSYRVIITPDDNRYVQYAGFRCAADQVK
jgi:serine/threonine protein kinase